VTNCAASEWLTMGSEEVQKIDGAIRARPGNTNRVMWHVAQTCSTSPRLEIRTLHVYVRHARWLAERVAEARLSNALATSLHQAPYRNADRFLTTVVMTDIVDSTDAVARLGDRRWRELLAEHYADCRTRVDNGGGELVNTTGDGILAIFDAPAQAVHAAMAIQVGARAWGIAVRAGVHTGECERLADGLAGLTVHIAARTCALAGAFDVLTTGTVRDLVTGSTLVFEPRGRHELRGVPGAWAIFKAIARAEKPSPAQTRREGAASAVGRTAAN
jgi:class 3 adenylate cyclase